MAGQPGPDNLAMAQALASLAMVFGNGPTSASGTRLPNPQVADRDPAASAVVRLTALGQRAAESAAGASSSSTTPDAAAGPDPAVALGAHPLMQLAIAGAGLGGERQQPMDLLNVLRSFVGAPSAGGTTPGVDGAPNPTEPTPKTKAKARKRKAADTTPKLQMSGMAGTGRFIDFTAGFIEGCDKIVWSWTTSTQEQCRKEENARYTKAIAQCTKRRIDCCGDGVTDANGPGMSADCTNYEIVFTGIVEINNVWTEFFKSKDAEVTLVLINKLADTLNNEPSIRHIWRGGKRRPLYQNEHLLRLKTTFTVKEVPFFSRNLLSLISADSINENCPMEVVEKMPDEHSQYTPEHLRKPAALRFYWLPGVFQERVWEYAIRQLYVHTIKSEDTMLTTYRQLFSPVFPDKLTAVENKEGDDAKEPAQKKAKVDLDEDVGFDDVDIDFDMFDAATMTKEEAERRANTRTLISDAAMNQAKCVCAMLWPNIFKDDLPNAIEQIHGGNAGAALSWIKVLQQNQYFKSLAAKAVQFNTLLRNFNTFYTASLAHWQEFSEFRNSTQALLDKLADMDFGQAALKECAAWSTNVARKLVPMTKADNLFAELDSLYSDVRIQGDLAPTLAERKAAYLKSFGLVIAVLKHLFLSTVKSVNNLAKVPARLDILRTSQTLIGEIVNIATQKVSAKKFLLVKDPKVTLAERLEKTVELFQCVADLCAEHYKDWEPILPQETEPSQEIQDNFNCITTRVATLDRNLNEADGSFFFALKGTAHDNPPDALLFFYQPLFLESDMAILNIYKEHQKAFRF